MSLSTISEKTFDVNDLPFQSVEVFRDRAEVKRHFEVQLDRGLNNVVVNNVCASVETDSIRVEGKGKAVIHEVQYKTDQVTNSETNTPQIKELIDELNEIELKKSKVDVLPMMYNKRLNSLDHLMSQLKLPTKDDSNSLLFDTNFEGTLNNFYEYYEQNIVALNTKLHDAEVESHKLATQSLKLKTQLEQLQSAKVVKRSICILLETLEDESVAEIELTYRVSKVSWTPSYDIRVSTTESKPRLKLIYYGNIVQSCGESWNNANLSLSTAQPCSGTQLPMIGTLKARLKQKPLPETRPDTGFGGGWGNIRANATTHTQQTGLFSATSNVSPSVFGSTQSNNVIKPEVVACSLPEYIAAQHAFSTTFTVKQKKTIPSDGSEHKVTIATLDLEPILHYDCVPSKSANVYLTTSVINTSSYPLINGKASVYVDNSFSTNIYINTVLQGEKFDCSLGIDPSVKVTYKPVHRYQQQVGIFNSIPATISEQTIVLKNTKQDELVLTIYEHVPKSSGEKIKTELLSPELEKSNLASIQQTDKESQLKTQEVGARLNNAHNLEWTIALKPMEERELVIKYAVMCPPTESVEYVEVNV
ncbi:hypothetical protein M3Y94_00936300 [Aphelenchoides besseyi]|nr:hypothetical protein M3Y94_00936300 [Aphelenchoides besseyi]